MDILEVKRQVSYPCQEEKLYSCQVVQNMNFQNELVKW